MVNKSLILWGFTVFLCERALALEDLTALSNPKRGHFSGVTEDQYTTLTLTPFNPRGFSRLEDVEDTIEQEFFVKETSCWSGVLSCFMSFLKS
ncbi:MAG TPA: hypothetical protein VI959_02220 [Alphaproteobacteria bacterium]|nr:hypothetical protein [Alphaproteobacteria bacterium]